MLLGSHLLLEGLDGLGAGVVELSGLADGRAAGAEQEDLGDLGSWGGGLAGGEHEAGYVLDLVLASVEEGVEEELGVSRTARRLGVELGAARNERRVLARR